MFRRPGPDPDLTPREREVLQLLRQGLNDDQIAGRLEISPAAVRYHVSQLLAKHGLDRREQLAPAQPGPAVLESASTAPRPGLRMPRLTRLRLALLLVVALVGGLYVWGLLLSDGGKGDGGGGVQVRWLQVDPPAPAAAELEHPYAASLPPSTPDVWRAYVVEGNAEPRLLFETTRLISGAFWPTEGDAILFSFFSQAGGPSPINGFMAVDAASGARTWERAFSLASTSISPAGAGKIAMAERQGLPGRGIYLLDADGASLRLEASWQNVTPGAWSPDGRWLLLFSRSTQPGGFTGGSYYAVAPPSREAVELGPLAQQPAWSPDGKRLAGIDGGEFVIFDLDGQVEKRGSLPGAAVLPGQSLTISWSADGRYVSYHGAVIEAASGRVLTPAVDGITLSVVSPDGSRLATSVACSQEGRTPGQAGLAPGRTDVTDLATGKSTPLIDCAAGYTPSSPRWLGADTLLLSAASCANDCQTPLPTTILAMLPAGKLVTLSQAPVFVGSSPASVSPDGSRFLLGGEQVRLYDVHGLLLRTIALPEGLVAGALAWSQDGRSFTYTAGPPVRSVFQGPGRPSR